MNARCKRLAAALLVAIPAVAAAAQPESLAAYESGLKARNGIGMAADAAGARRALETAAQGGVPAAMFVLAQMLAAGEGGARDEAAARRWLERAAELDYPEALQELALAETDPRRAAELLRAAGHVLQHRAREGAGH